MSDSKLQTLIVIPTYNEAENISHLLPTIWQSAPDVHILVVDDNSPDNTAGLVETMRGSGGHGHHLFLLKRAGKLGLGTAYISGFKWGLEKGYQAILEMDADFSHDPKALPAIIANLKSYPVVIGSRYVPGGGTRNWSKLREFISRGGSLYARMILGMRVRDLTGGFNAWRAEVLRRINLDLVRSEGYSFQIELKYRAHRANFALHEEPIVFVERRAGQSKMSSKIVFEAMLRVWWLRFKSAF